MKSILSKMLMLTVGAVVGSAVTWKLVKTKYERIAQEEIDSVKEVFNRRLADQAKDKPSLEQLSAALHQMQYKLESSSEESAEDKEWDDYMNGPYIIKPEVFGEYDDYETISLSYYADGVLTDEMDEVIEDVEGMVGKESLTHFGDYDDDAIYVRNEEEKTDYEILRDLKTYAELHDDPQSAEEE